MRKQYHSRLVDGRRLVWDCDRLVRLSRDLPRKRVPLAAIRELDEPYWQGEGEGPMTCREVVDHARLIEETDLSYPIILSADGRVMDGMHRVGKAVLEGRAEIEAVRFTEDPEPDYVDVPLSDLPY